MTTQTFFCVNITIRMTLTEREVSVSISVFSRFSRSVCWILFSSEMHIYKHTLVSSNQAKSNQLMTNLENVHLIYASLNGILITFVSLVRKVLRAAGNKFKILSCKNGEFVLHTPCIEFSYCCLRDSIFWLWLTSWFFLSASCLLLSSSTWRMQPKIKCDFTEAE